MYNVDFILAAWGQKRTLAAGVFSYIKASGVKGVIPQVKLRKLLTVENNAVLPVVRLWETRSLRLEWIVSHRLSTDTRECGPPLPQVLLGILLLWEGVWLPLKFFWLSTGSHFCAALVLEILLLVFKNTHEVQNIYKQNIHFKMKNEHWKSYDHVL